MTPELEALAQRLEEVERQVAHLIALVTEQTDTDRTIEVRKLVVRDDEGQRRVELGTVTNPRDKDEALYGPWLGLFDSNEQVRACIGVGGQGASGPMEGPWLELYNAKGQTGVEIAVGENGPEVRLFDAKGKVAIVAATSEEGPILMLSSPNENQPPITLTATESSTDLFVGRGMEGPCVRLKVNRDGPCLLFGKDNKVFWSAP